MVTRGLIHWENTFCARILSSINSQWTESGKRGTAMMVFDAREPVGYVSLEAGLILIRKIQIKEA